MNVAIVAKSWAFYIRGNLDMLTPILRKLGLNFISNVKIMTYSINLNFYLVNEHLYLYSVTHS